MNPERLRIDATSSDEEISTAVSVWLGEHVPQAWRDAAPNGRRAIRAVRPRKDYEDWYPVFAASGLAVATWPVEYGGLDLPPAKARVAELVLAPLNLGRLNPLGLHNTAPALFAHGTEEQRLRFLPPMVANRERWCQMFSEPGAGSDLASLAMRAERDGEEWVLTGQKVWSTWAHESEFAICLARTDPTAPSAGALPTSWSTCRRPASRCGPCATSAARSTSTRCGSPRSAFPTSIASAPRATDGGWPRRRWPASARWWPARDREASTASAAGDRESASAGRYVGVGPVERDRLLRLYCEEKVRAWTNERVRATVKAGGTPGPAASIGKVHQGQLNQAIQLAAADLLGMASVAWTPEKQADGQDPLEAWAAGMPYAAKGMLRSRANTIEGGTTEVNKNVIGEKVLGLPREPDPYHDMAWQDVPR